MTAGLQSETARRYDRLGDFLAFFFAAFFPVIAADFTAFFAIFFLVGFASEVAASLLFFFGLAESKIRSQPDENLTEVPVWTV